MISRRPPRNEVGSSSLDELPDLFENIQNSMRKIRDDAYDRGYADGIGLPLVEKAKRKWHSRAVKEAALMERVLKRWGGDEGLPAPPCKGDDT